MHLHQTPLAPPMERRKCGLHGLTPIFVIHGCPYLIVSIFLCVETPFLILLWKAAIFFEEDVTFLSLLSLDDIHARC